MVVGYNYLYVYAVKGLDASMGKRKRQLTLVYVGEGSSHGRQRVEAQEEEAHISQEARPIASDDDETQEPGTKHVFK